MVKVFQISTSPREGVDVSSVCSIMNHDDATLDGARDCENDNEMLSWVSFQEKADSKYVDIHVNCFFQS